MRNIKVFAKQHPAGMAIYVEHHGETSFVMTHRKNNHLFFYLCDEGKSLHEMKFYRPGRNRADQAFSKSLSHVVKLTEYVIEEMAA